MTELVTFGETPLQFSPQGYQRLEMARETTVYADGTESNVAVAAEELGADTMWLSKAPETPLGRRVVTQLQEQGIETRVRWADSNSGVRQGLKFRENGSTPRNGKVWHDRSNTAASTAEPADFPMDTVKQAAVVFTGISTPVLSEQAAETTQAILRASGGSGAVTAADLDYSPGLASKKTYRDMLEFLSDELDMLVANAAVARDVLDRKGGSRELANVLAAEYDLEIAVITRSEQGAVALHDTPGTNVIHERQTTDVEAVDPTGQHGAFVGAFLQQLISGADTARALSYAVATATLARTMPGPFLNVNGEEIEALVEEIVELSQ